MPGAKGKGARKMSGTVAFAFQGRREKNTTIELHTHPGPEIVFYISGFGETTIGRERYIFGSGDFSVIEAGTPHDEYHSTDTDLLFIRFADHYSFPIGGKLCHGGGDEIYPVLQCILKETFDQRPGYRQMLESKCSELQVLLARLEANPKPAVRDLSYILNYLENHFSEKVELSRLADLCGYSYDYFRHLFRERTGVSCMEYVMNLRFEEAKTALLTTNRSITDIAAHCGFWGSAQFSALFKKRYGLSPKDYRKEHRKAN